MGKKVREEESQCEGRLLRLGGSRTEQAVLGTKEGRWQLTLSASVCLFVGLEIPPQFGEGDPSLAVYCLLEAGTACLALPGPGSRGAGSPAPPHSPGIETDAHALERL